MSIEPSVKTPDVEPQPSVFYPRPTRVHINENREIQFSKAHTIETLMQELKKGSVVALGKWGPTHYESPPVRIKQNVDNEIIYGWKAGTEQYKYSRNTYAIILGAKKDQQYEYVFYTLSQDVTKKKHTYLREHQPSDKDKKIYVISFKSFNQYLKALYPSYSISNNISDKKTAPEEKEEKKSHCIQKQLLSLKQTIHRRDKLITSLDKIKDKLNEIGNFFENEKMPDLSPSELEYAKKLSALTPVNEIFFGKTSCRQIGEEIFQHYKKQDKGNSLAGKAALEKIKNSIKFISQDGVLRMHYIEYIWDGIGDKNVTFSCE